MTGLTIPASVAREALGRVLASEEFRASPNLTAFLRFIVERTLEGREDTIKAYTVATEVLGRAESFDPQVDPIVRVEATRLRRSLERYYGRCADPVVIDIPRGSYIPTFAMREEDPASAAEAAAAATSEAAATATALANKRQASGRVALVGGMAMMLVAVVAVASAWWPAETNRGVQTTGALDRSQPTLAALTNEPASFPGKVRQPQSLTTFGTVLIPPIAETTEAGRTHAALLTDLLRNGLARFEDITVVEIGPQSAGATPPLAEDTYTLTGRLLRQGASSKVSLRLRHELSQRIVWSGEFIIGLTEGQGLSETAFMRRVAAIVASPSGVVASDAGGAKRQADPLSVPAACLLEANSWLSGARDEANSITGLCLERTIADFPRFAAGWAMLASADIEKYRLDVGATNDHLLDMGLAHARMAVTLAPQSARSLQVLSDVLAAQGDAAAAEKAIERAIELNPYSLEVLQSAGFRQIERGEYRKGLAILSEVAQAGAPDNPWRSLLLAVAMANLAEKNDSYAGMSDQLPHPAALLSNLITKGAQAQAGAGRAVSAKLSQSFPDVARDPTSFMKRANLQQSALVTVSEKLRLATAEPKS